MFFYQACAPGDKYRWLDWLDPPAPTVWGWEVTAIGALVLLERYGDHRATRTTKTPPRAPCSSRG
ncbi:MAG: hypothetical protein J2P16_11495, partial [Mycobacterium sp.]|nr:hypothetical protein [Mycobacterium sp.]